MAYTRRCPKCKSNNLVKEDGRQKCLSCGYEIVSKREKHAFIIANAKEIANDYLELGYEKTIYKWRISKTALYAIPEIKEVRIQRPQLYVKPTDGQMPDLPQFSNEWSSEVQLKWLEIWEKQKEVVPNKK